MASVQPENRRFRPSYRGSGPKRGVLGAERRGTNKGLGPRPRKQPNFREEVGAKPKEQRIGTTCFMKYPNPPMSELEVENTSPEELSKEVVYLDWNATTPIYPEVADAMEPYLRIHYGNPSSGHLRGRVSNEAVRKAREQVARLVGADSDEDICFTSCGTEADNWVILGSVERAKSEFNIEVPHVVTSNIEHPAIIECLKYLKSKGRITYTEVPVNQSGIVDANAVVEAVQKDTCLCTIMHSNNEIGSLQPVEEIGRMLSARHPNVWFHTDAAQSIGKVDFDVKSMNVDFATIVGHKFGAPKGIGALYIRKGLKIDSFLMGGGQESKRRAGTENILHIVGIGAAAEIARIEGKQLQHRYLTLKNRMRSEFEKVFAEHSSRLHFNGPEDDSLMLPNTLSLSIEGVNANALIDRLGFAVALSAGAACHSNATSASSVLSAIGLPLELSLGTMRLSVGRSTKELEIDAAVKLICKEAFMQLESTA